MSTQLEKLILGTVPLANFTANGALGTAVATVDIAPCFAIAQTTVGITLTIPTPTIAAVGLTIKIVNTGSAALTVAGVSIGANQSTEFTYSGTAWTIATAVTVAVALATIGDAKSGFQTADHGSGWILLDGRLKTALTATQQTQATALGFGLNIPNATGRAFVQGTLGAQIGSSTITQANLPAVNLSGGSHGHGITDPGHGHGAPAVSIGTRNVATGTNYSVYSNSFNDGFSSTFVSVGGVPANTTGVSVAASGALSIPLGGSGSAYIPSAIGVNQFCFLGA